MDGDVAAFLAHEKLIRCPSCDAGHEEIKMAAPDADVIAGECGGSED
jgi:hypothetical protein